MSELAILNTIKVSFKRESWQSNRRYKEELNGNFRTENITEEKNQ